MKTLLTAALLLLPVQAFAECAERDIVVKVLTGENHKEEVVASGITGHNTVIEVWANLEKGTWSLTETNANGITCLHTAGVAFNEIRLPVGDPT